MVHKDIKKLVTEAKKQGFQIEYAGSGHLIVRKDGRRIATLSATPSSPSSILNAQRELKEAGLIWPPRGKKPSGR